MFVSLPSGTLNDWLPIALLSVIACIFLALQACVITHDAHGGRVPAGVSPTAASRPSPTGGGVTWFPRRSVLEARAIAAILFFAAASGASTAFSGSSLTTQFAIATRMALSVQAVDTTLQVASFATCFLALRWTVCVFLTRLREQ